MDEREYLEHLEAIGRYITSVDKVQVSIVQCVCSLLINDSSSILFLQRLSSCVNVMYHYFILQSNSFI